MRVSDYFAELFVAGRFADAGWNVYFPHRDKGFDFIISKLIDGNYPLIRPVQVKGKYPTDVKTDKSVYGYVGGLTQIHQQMVLAIPYFTSSSPETPCCVAYLPFSIIKPHTRGFRCEPAKFFKGIPSPRPGFAKFFNKSGLNLIESRDWDSQKL